MSTVLNFIYYEWKTKKKILYNIMYNLCFINVSQNKKPNR